MQLLKTDKWKMQYSVEQLMDFFIYIFNMQLYNYIFNCN